MPVETTNAYSGPYATNGVTTVFPFTFSAMAADDVAVILRDADGVDTIASGYTVTLTGTAPSPGSVTFDVAPVTGLDLIPYLDIEFTQSTEFEDGSAWLARPVNNANDRSVLRDQVLKRDNDRAIRGPIGEDGLTLPSASARAGKYLAFDGDGNMVPSLGTGDDPALRSDLEAATGAELVGAGGGETVQGVLDALSPIITPATEQTLPTRTARLNFPASGPGAMFAFGTNGPNAGANYSGLQIGGGDALWGTEGVYGGGDGHPVWLRWQPTRNYSPIENVIYPTAAQGHAQKVNGTNQLTYVDGSTFDPAWVGRKIYWGTETYRVASAAGSTITVTTTAGAPVVFSGAATAIYHVFYVYGTGICNVSGSTVTHVSGDPFLYFAADPAHELKINGTTRAVSSGAGAPYTLTLSAPPGDVTGATYEYFTDIDDTMVQLRLQKFLGSTEENITKGVKPWCYFERTQAAGGGLHYPVHYGSGDGKAQITLMPDGTTRFGWHGSIANPNVNTTNYFELDSATTGINPAFRARGVDTNIGLGFDTKGTGAVTFTSGSFGRINFRIYGSNAPDYLVTDAATGAPFLAAEGASANIDIPILAKGSGVVRFGTWTSSGDTAVNGYITVKDAAGNVRKLATIA